MKNKKRQMEKKHIFGKLEKKQQVKQTTSVPRRVNIKNCNSDICRFVSINLFGLRPTTNLHWFGSTPVLKIYH